MPGRWSIAVASWLAAVLSSGIAGAQSPAPGGMPPPPGMSLAESAARRFPQPVRVGDLLHHDVLQPVEAQTRLGQVDQLVEDGGGRVFVIIRYGGFLGFGARLIAVPVDAMVLVGQDMEVVAYAPAELDRFPTYARKEGETPVGVDRQVRIGLAKPSH